MVKKSKRKERVSDVYVFPMLDAVKTLLEDKEPYFYNKEGEELLAISEKEYESFTLRMNSCGVLGHPEQYRLLKLLQRLDDYLRIYK